MWPHQCSFFIRARCRRLDFYLYSMTLFLPVQYDTVFTCTVWHCFHRVVRVSCSVDGLKFDTMIVLFLVIPSGATDHYYGRSIIEMATLWLFGARGELSNCGLGCRVVVGGVGLGGLGRGGGGRGGGWGRGGGGWLEYWRSKLICLTTLTAWLKI